MATAKIEFTLGSITFSGEGEETWVSAQLDKILEKAPSLMKIVPMMQSISQPASTASGQPSPLSDATISTQTLPNFLRSKEARSGFKKFLATAIWLHAKGNPKLSTTDINKALKDYSQSRLSNATDSLNTNVSKGYCEKDGRQFFVTDEGREFLSD